ncbi:cytosolic carboxypeptidase 2 [Solea solea]|uniref:cytosolic carboxypeptidase 2 n=1 Tax=Solea solea TaxID=90069 RepID=UPI00272AAED4|nr:cytosolic carboxypeptidase 2 [Solea solea]XP_058502308.1 cytosolic carboxypeptidase 2 [Solea solea]
MAVSAIRNWWNTYLQVKSDTDDSSTEEEEEKLSDKGQLSANLHQTLRTRQLLIDFDGSRPVFSLRAPRDLVNFPSISRPHWPTECEVISDIVHHIEWDPPEPEPFYQPTGHERTPLPLGEERGKVVFCIDHATKQPYFTCSRVGGSRGPVKRATPDVSQTDFTLEFESRFESGNLQKAVQVGDHEYELTLSTDMYTRKHTQWFYFRVRNMKAGVTYRFTIVNLMKSSSLYSLGMKPLLYSEKAAKEKGVGWQRTGSNIKYYRNCNPNTKDNNSDTIPLYSLTWTLHFPYDSDTCYLSHCYPYTYSRLQRYLRQISSNPKVVSYCTMRVLCHSLAGNTVYVMTITNRADAKLESRRKKAVVVTARVHPGETNGSWMMEGLLDFLLGDSEDAQLLRDTFVFKIVPMLNPDGVVVGNYRCSLTGRDLNRNYKTLLRESFPCVLHTLNMVKRLVAEMDVVLYCDFHGHNRKNNVFMYGCSNRSDASLKLQERVFPLMMSKNASNKFSFKSCKFRVHKSKEGTGRIAMWRLGIRNSYTMEATFGGSTLGDRRGTHFSTRDLKSMGFYFCDTLLDYCDPDATKTTHCLAELAVLLRKQVKERLGKDLRTDFNISMSDLETSTSGSNSSDSDGLPVHLLNQTVHPEGTPVKKKKKKKKKKKRLRSHKERNRLRQERVKINTEQKVPQSSPTNIETTVKEIVPEKPFGQHRTKWQVNGLIKKAVIIPPNLNPEVSQVNMWQGCEPKDDCLDKMKTSYLQRQTDDQRMDTGQWRCSSQLLHLSALILPTPNLMLPSQRQYHCSRPSLVSYNVCRGLLPSLATSYRSPSSLCVKMAPDTTKRLLSTFTSDKINNRCIYRDRKSLWSSERYYVPDDSSPSHTDVTKTEEQEDDPPKVGLSVFGCLPFGEQKQGNITPDPSCGETEAHSSLFEPVMKTSDLRGKRLCKETPVSKPSGLLKMKLPHPQSDTLSKLQTEGLRHYDNRRQSQKRTDPQEAVVAITRPSQSAPL